MLSRIFRTESEIRQRQINTLKIFNDNVIDVVEGSEYCITFQSHKNELTLQVLLTNEFPNEKPILKISPCVVHPWVNSDGEIISAPGLLNFTVHSDLGRVVQAIIREFERNPPPLSSNTSTSSSPMFFQGVSSPIYTVNTVCFPELNRLTLEDLHLLNENIDKQDEFIESLPQIREMNKTLDDLLIQIEELADANLTKKSSVDDLYTERKTRIDLLNKLLQNNEVLNENYQLLSDRYKPSNIKESLQIASSEADEQSESIAESFLKGDLDVDNFVSSYIKSRIISHTRKAKEEKLTHQLSELERAGF